MSSPVLLHDVYKQDPGNEGGAFRLRMHVHNNSGML
jgi:hypothetical protein